jgi:hypothetical protein
MYLEMFETNVRRQGRPALKNSDNNLHIEGLEMLGKRRRLTCIRIPGRMMNLASLRGGVRAEQIKQKDAMEYLAGIHKCLLCESKVLFARISGV